MHVVALKQSCEASVALLPAGRSKSIVARKVISRPSRRGLGNSWVGEAAVAVSRAGADGDALDAQADEARAQADVAIDELTRRALAALEILSTFEAQSASLRELEEAAQSALRDVSEWISTRSGTPRAVAAILSEAYRSRVTIARARAEAAQAACDLWMASGVDPAAWPREAR